MPGEFRTTQNWVGAGNSPVATARFVPPPPTELGRLLHDWEQYAHEAIEVPLLVQNALLHYQFETLHPFLDGNGRLGRLLTVFMLIEHGRLPAPLLYLSAYLERERDQYYQALQTVREEGDIIPWLEMFLASVHSQAADAVTRSQRMVELREKYRDFVATIHSGNAMRLVDLVCETPIVSARIVEDHLGVTRPTALKLLRQLESVGVLDEDAVGPRGQRRYRARELMEAITEDQAS
jgi:Fic family protein